MVEMVSEDENMSLESALEDLEKIVQALDDDTLSLEDSLDIFERGVRLVRLCNANLERAEQKIETLTGELPEDIRSRR
ncbi:MAG: exodeoxyribonuclease VII small subunit [Methanotrichaceae archaeon]